MPERRLMVGRAGLGALLWAALVLTGTGQASSTDALARARAALAAGDGIAAEAELRRALDAGVPRPQVTAAMGEALLLQGNPDQARAWLAGREFAAGQEGYGWRMLGRVEQAQGNLPAAGKAYDQALRHTPDDGRLWVDIGRLRYAGGEQVQAIEAADHALRLAPTEVRALEFRGQLVRDVHGLIPALAWFERGLSLDPDDLGLLGEYAATLGELDRAHAMLEVTRRMLALDAGNPRALFLQAVLVARAGKSRLARDLLNRGGDRLGHVPAALLLRGVLELDAGNANLAIDSLDRLVRAQPSNAGAAHVLARAAYVAGDDVQLRKLAAALREPSPYLLALGGRAREREGRRDLAAPLLDRAAKSVGEGLEVLGEDEDLRVLAADWAERPGLLGAGLRYVRKLLGAGDLAGAEAIAERLRAANPGSGDAQAIAGDVQLLRGNAGAAIERYAIAARVRADAGLVARQVRALEAARRSGEADTLVEARLAASPTDPALNRLAADRAAARRDWPRAAALARYVAARDPRSPGALQLLAEALLALGDRDGARQAALSLQALQPARPDVTALVRRTGGTRLAAAAD
jgi:cellulose synthase operon protein C